MTNPERGVAAFLLQDWQRNSGDKKAQVVMFAFRFTAWINRTQAPFAKVVAKPVKVAYRVAVDWVLNVEIPHETLIGPGLRLQHAQGIVINANTRIGSDVSIHQGVTLGGRKSGDDCPTIGDGVRIGAGAIVIGALSIGERSHIGAGAVVLSDVPMGASAVGNPARILARQHPV